MAVRHFSSFISALVLALTPVCSMGAVAYVSNGGLGSASGTSVAVNVPSGVVNGDLLIAEIGAVNQTAAFPTETGWTLALAVDGTNGPNYLGIFYRYASSEPASYTFTGGTGTTYIEGYIIRVTGAVTSGNPFDALGAGNSISTTTLSTASSITTATANDLLFQFSATTDGSVAVSSYQSGYTGVSSSFMAFAYESFVGPGSTGSATITYASNINGATVLGAIKPASGAACTNAGFPSSGSSPAVPNGTSGSYRGKSGDFVTPDCATVYYKNTAGNFGTN